MRLNRPFPRHERGFSLVELMVAMAAGLIVLGAAVIFAVTSMRSYSENILSSKLSQELRTSMNLVVRELRRAGHDATAVSRVLTTTSASGFTDLTVVEDDEGCVVYQYDRTDTSERRGFRLEGGVLQLKVSNAAIACDDADGWEDVTDPEIVEITKFHPQLFRSSFCSEIDSRDTAVDVDLLPDEFLIAEGQVRTVSMCLQGRTVSGDTITRHVTDSVRLRAEFLEFQPWGPDECEEPVAENPISTSDLNDECDDP